MKLSCQDISEVEVLSACLQDGITSLGKMAMQKHHRQFAVMFSRFMWEDTEIAKSGGGTRVRCGIHFNDVLSVNVRDIDQSDLPGLLPLLALEVEEKGENFEIVLIFAGHGSIKLLVECVDIHLSDQGEPWSTPNRPDHSRDDA